MASLIIAGTVAGLCGLSGTLLGFGTAGIAAGSVAAATQATIGNVAAGSVFSTLTSWGMTGVFTTATYGGGVVAAIGSAIKGSVSKDIE